VASGFYAYTLCNVLFLTTVWRYSILKQASPSRRGLSSQMAVAGRPAAWWGAWGIARSVVPGALVWAGGMAYFANAAGGEPRLPRRVAAGGW